MAEGRFSHHLLRFLRRWGLPFLLAALPALWLAKLTFGGQVLYWGIPLQQFYPWRSLVVEAWRAGVVPLWNPWLGGGAPLLANHQSAALYPLSVLFLLFPVERALGYSILVHLSLAAVGMYGYARHLGRTRPASTLSALAFAFGGYIVARANFPTMVCAMAWVPLVLWAGDRLALRPSPWRAAALGCVLALQFLAGHAQLWYYTVWMAAPYVLWRAASRARMGSRLAGATHALPQGHPPRTSPLPPGPLPLSGSERGRGPGDGERSSSPTSPIPLAPFPPRMRGGKGVPTTGGQGTVGSQRASLCGSLAALVGAVLLAVLLSAAQFLPTVELARESPRQGGAEYEFAMTYSFWPWRFLTLVVPDLFGNPGHGDYWGYANYWEDAAYAGLLPLFLATYAGWRWARSRRDPPNARPAPLETASFFLALVPISLLLALGKNTPLYPLVFRWMPGFGFFQAPSRLLCWYAVAMAVLAGIGWDLLGPSPRLGRAGKFLCVGALGIAVAALGARVALPQVRGTFSRALFATGDLGLILGFLLTQRARLSEVQRGAGAWWSVAALAFAAVDLLLFSLPLVPTVDPRLYHLRTETGQWLRAQEETGPFRIYTFGETEYDIRYRTYLRFDTFGPADVDFLMGLRETLLPDLNVMEGIAHAGNFDPLLVGRYERFLARANEVPLEEGLRLLGLLNVGYLLEPGLLGDLEPVHVTPHVRIYRNPHVLPRAWVVHRARAVPDPEALLLALTEPTFDPLQEVLLEEPAPLPGGPEAPVAVGTTHASPLPDAGPTAGVPDGASRHGEDVPLALHIGPSGVTIDVALVEPGYLCLSQTFYPGWEARVDGKSAAVVRGDYLLTVVPLPAGVHRVDLQYRPQSFWVGAGVSAGAWSFLAVAAGLRLWRRRRAT